VHIAAVGWIYVTLMMAITEETVIAGIMTFFLYGVLPTVIIVYLGCSPQRRRRNEEARLRMMQERQTQSADEAKEHSDRAS
jgi:biotin transporter BioY